MKSTSSPMNRQCYCVLLLVMFPLLSSAQTKTPPFWNEIKAFKKSDSISFPSPHQILFVGSSSFRLWKNLQKDFPEFSLINRGFGGSSITNVSYYFNDIIKPYHARQIVIYCGDNDFAADSKLPVDSVVSRFETLFGKIRTIDKKVMVTFISIKPSPSRKIFMPKFVEANNRIRLFLKKKKHTSFVDVYHKMLDEQGAPLKAIFLSDSLHMNAKGYAIWQREIKPFLLKK